MIQSTLTDAIQSQSEARTLLIRDDESFSSKSLIQNAKYLRHKHTELRNQIVALKITDVASFIIHLIALDGWCRKILLLPSTFEDCLTTSLIEQADCRYLVTGTGITAKNEGHLDIPFAETKWILTTSGTTNKPKLIEHTLASLGRSIKADLAKGHAFRWGLLYDPARFAGLQVILQSLLGGSCLAISAEQTFDRQIECILKNQVNALSATPSLWRKLLMDRKILTLDLKQITLGGEIVDQTLLSHLQSVFPNGRIVHIYASTEAGVGFSVTDGLAGFPSKWLECNITPIALKINSAGRLCLKPLLTAKGEEIKKRLDSDGFLDTEDLVQRQGDRIYFIGRASGAINVGGNKVHPEEVENIIRELDKVIDVRVYGKNSPLMGQLVLAELTIDESENKQTIRQSVMQHCKNKLEPYKVPALIHFVDSISMTPAGKTERYEKTT